MRSIKTGLRVFIFSGLLFFSAFLLPIQAQSVAASEPNKSQELSDVEGVPVLLLHLPEWNKVRDSAVFATGVDELRPLLGERQIYDLIEFNGGTEAAAAPYDAGKLLIIEYTTPQAASYADGQFLQRFSQNSDPTTVYRRIGNYSVFVFDVVDPAAANALADQVKYEKSVQWLGEDPFLLSRFERYLAITGRDVAISTALWIAGAAAIAISIGLVTGLIFFRLRERKRGTQEAFSDAGGMIRLNLDDLSEPLR